MDIKSAGGSPSRKPSAPILLKITGDYYTCPQYGIERWDRHFPNAAGKAQSPIDIRPQEITYDWKLSGYQFKFDYKPSDFTVLKNTGASWQLDAKENSSSTLNVGFLENDDYQVVQVHAHWGRDSKHGAEHLIAGIGCAMEVHIVHVNTKYGSLQEALNHQDGLLVLGIFCEEGAHNEAFQPLVDLSSQIAWKGDKISLDGFDVSQLVPRNVMNFFCYNGSLTTPPCNECVIWVLIDEHVTISREQLDRFRSMHRLSKGDDDHENPRKISRNVRPVQPLNERHVRSSFPVTNFKYR